MGTTTSQEHSPAICALPPTVLPERLGAWRRVTDRALSRENGPGWARATYPAAVLTELRALVEAEADCCPFLSFEVRERRDVIELELEFPPEFAPMIAALGA